jgi:hypothetical protein
MKFIALICIFYLGESLDMQSPINKDYIKVEKLLLSIAKSKVLYEESIYWKKKDTTSLFNNYSNLVKKFKKGDSLNYYDSTIKRLIINEADKKEERYIEFTFEPTYLNKKGRCAYLRYYEFLKVMLSNLHNSTYKTTIICNLST